VSDVAFTGTQLTLLGIVFAPLLTAIGFLFKAVISAKDAHLVSKDKEIEKGEDELREALTTNKELAAAVKEATAELRELRQDLWRERRVGNWREDPT
jgi:septal ring factor EnvC (AmiA/AmiB activator)